MGAAFVAAAHQKLGVTAFIITHDLPTAFRIADRVGLLHEGRIIEAAPRRIVYVSCNPSTLARDAGLLVHQAGYRCTAAGIVNMFPHTAHVESIAVFDLDR